jgi:hypothetical protein
MREPLSCYIDSAPGIQKLAITGSEKRGLPDQITGQKDFLGRMGCRLPALLRRLRETLGGNIHRLRSITPLHNLL